MMTGSRKPSGVYIEVADGTPVSDTLIKVALKPSADHVFADGWATAPLDPAVCWRVKTAQELTAGKDSEFQAFMDSMAGKAFKSLATALIKKGTVTLAEIRAEWRAL
jgi:hypothetical protein